MKFIITVDENNYITKLEPSEAEEAVEISHDIYAHPFIKCYKYIDGELTLDEDKVNSIIDATKIVAEVAELKQKLLDTDYIWNAIREGAHDENYYAETIANRKAWRERIQELQNKTESK